MNISNHISKDVVGFIGRSYFLEILLSSCCVQSKFWFNEKAGLLGLSTDSVVVITYSLSFAELPDMGALGVLHSQGIVKAICGGSCEKWRWTLTLPITCISSARVRFPLSQHTSLNKLKFKDKLLESFRTVISDH